MWGYCEINKISEVGFESVRKPEYKSFQAFGCISRKTLALCSLYNFLLFAWVKKKRILSVISYITCFSFLFSIYKKIGLFIQ